MLSIVAISYFLPDGVSNSRPVQNKKGFVHKYDMDGYTE